MTNESIFYLIGLILGTLLGFNIARITIKRTTVIQLNIPVEDMQDSDEEG